MSKPVLREARLFAPLKAWFEARGYDVFAEVPCFNTAIDLIAIKGDIVVAVELKVSLTKQVIRQAQLNDMCSDKSYAAVGTNPRNIQRCADAGVGLLTVRDGVVSLALEPRPRHPASDFYKRQIQDKCKRGVFDGVGGVPCLEGVGPAQDCKRRVDAYRTQHPGATWREVFANVPNHYASHNSMRQSLTAGLEKYARIKELRKLHRANRKSPAKTC